VVVMPSRAGSRIFVSGTRDILHARPFYSPLVVAARIWKLQEYISVFDTRVGVLKE